MPGRVHPRRFGSHPNDGRAIQEAPTMTTRQRHRDASSHDIRAVSHRADPGSGVTAHAPWRRAIGLAVGLVVGTLGPGTSAMATDPATPSPATAITVEAGDYF